MKFAQQESEHQRRVILGLLEKDPDYSHNEVVIKSALKSVGHHISTDKLRGQLAWLEEQGLITVERVIETDVARLTERGLDVASGASSFPGIARKAV